MIFSFRQNNSGGYYTEPAKSIIVKDASDEKSAIEIALKAGMYFNGIADGKDCSCCGDRWYCMPFDHDTIDEAIEFVSNTYDDGSSIPQYIIVEELSGVDQSEFDKLMKDMDEVEEFMNWI